MTARILVSDPFSEAGIKAFEQAGLSVDAKFDVSPVELREIIGGYDGLVVRSRTKVTPEVIDAAKRLKVIGRAGVGVDNINLDAATEHGIVVMNTPGGSSVTVAEHTFAMLLALARNIPAATASMKAGRWEKKKLKGHELAGKTLGVMGFGRIGSMVAERALAFGMKVVVYDPFIAREAGAALGVEVVDLDELLSRSDVVSLHVPLTNRTHHVIDRERLKQLKPGAYVINCARGGVVDEDALAEALAEGHLGGAAMDVYEKEPPDFDSPLFKLDTFICAPHLGASTVEAQEHIALQLADQMIDFFKDGAVRNSVNVPSVSREVLEKLGTWLRLATKVGEMAAQLAPERPTRLTVECSGEITKHDLTPITNHVLAGLLRHFTADPVNTVNAPALARQRGLVTSQAKTAATANYASTVGARIIGAEKQVEVVGSVFGKPELRIVQVDEFGIDAVAEGTLLVIRNRDVPGIAGRVGSTLGEFGINIGRIHLSRTAPHGEAFSIINVDSTVPGDVLGKLRAIPDVESVTQIHL